MTSSPFVFSDLWNLDFQELLDCRERLVRWHAEGLARAAQEHLASMPVHLSPDPNTALGVQVEADQNDEGWRPTVRWWRADGSSSRLIGARVWEQSLQDEGWAGDIDGTTARLLNEQLADVRVCPSGQPSAIDGGQDCILKNETFGWAPPRAYPSVWRTLLLHLAFERALMRGSDGDAVACFERPGGGWAWVLYQPNGRPIPVDINSQELFFGGFDRHPGLRAGLEILTQLALEESPLVFEALVQGWRVRPLREAGPAVTSPLGAEAEAFPPWDRPWENRLTALTKPTQGWIVGPSALGSVDALLTDEQRAARRTRRLEAGLTSAPTPRRNRF